MKEKLIQVECFLHRVFPFENYENIDEIVKNQLFSPRKDCDPFFISFPLDWEMESKKIDRNWRMQLQGWTFFHPIMNVFDSYKNKKLVINYFLETVADWWGRYGNDPDDIVTSRMPRSYAWYDMSVGFRALVIAFFCNRLDFYGLSISENQKELLDNVVAKHIRHLRNPATFSMNNHGLFQSHGLVGLLKLKPNLSSTIEADLSYAIKLVEKLIISQFGKQGIHLEHSPHYHFYALNTLESQIKSGWYDSSEKILSLAKDAKVNCKWLLDPKKRPVCIGDSILTKQSSVFFPKKPISGHLISNFSESGYAIVRSGWGVDDNCASMLFLMGGYHSKAHKHRDCLSFDWYDQGERIICDSGKYGYKIDKYRNYFLSNRAHNTVEIESFDVLRMRPYISCLEDPIKENGGVYILKGKLDWSAIKHSRVIYFKPSEWVVISDSLKFSRVRSYTQWFHLNTDYKLLSAKNNNIKLRGNGQRYLDIQCFSGNVLPEIYCGDEEVMQGFLCERDYQYKDALAIGFNGHGDEDNLVTLLSLSDSAKMNALNYLYEKKLISKSEMVDVHFSKELIPRVHNYTFLCAKDLSISSFVGANTYQVNIDGIPISFYGDFRRKKKRLAVFLPGATKRVYGVYDFQRYTWSEELVDFDCLFFSDPSIQEKNDLTLGWFQYSKDSYGIDSLAKLIKIVIKEKDYQESNVLIFGSSGGGFVSLKLAEYFTEALIVALNPQIYLYNYTKPYYLNMLKWCYGNENENIIKTSFFSRISVSGTFDSERGNPVFIIQNTADERHMVRHLKPLLRKIGGKVLGHLDDVTVKEYALSYCCVNVLTYYDEKSKHNPPEKKVTLKILTDLLKLKK